MNPKLLIALVILIVLLAAAAIVVGVSSGSSSPLDFKFGGLDQIAAGLVPENKLKAADIGSATPASCLDLVKKGSLAMEGGQSCVFSVKSSSASSRTLEVVLSQGSGLRVEARLAVAEDGSRMQVKDTIGQNESYQLQFLKEGGTVILWCEGGVGTKCSVTVK
jgi:hypothetical protein